MILSIHRKYSAEKNTMKILVIGGSSFIGTYLER